MAAHTPMCLANRMTLVAGWWVVVTAGDTGGGL
jgi:hypothetical protein